MTFFTGATLQLMSLETAPIDNFDLTTASPVVVTTPLHAAVQRGDLKTVDYLVSHEIPGQMPWIYYEDQYGKRPMWYAVKRISAEDSEIDERDIDIIIRLMDGTAYKYSTRYPARDLLLKPDGNPTPLGAKLLCFARVPEEFGMKKIKTEELNDIVDYFHCNLEDELLVRGSARPVNRRLNFDGLEDNDSALPDSPLVTRRLEFLEEDDEESQPPTTPLRQRTPYNLSSAIHYNLLVIIKDFREAIEEDNVHLAEAMLDLTAQYDGQKEKQVLNYRYSDGKTPLIIAIQQLIRTKRNGDTSLILMLIKHGVIQTERARFLLKRHYKRRKKPRAVQQLLRALN